MPIYTLKRWSSILEQACIGHILNPLWAFFGHFVYPTIKVWSSTDDAWLAWLLCFLHPLHGGDCRWEAGEGQVASLLWCRWDWARGKTWHICWWSQWRAPVSWAQEAPWPVCELRLWRTAAPLPAGAANTANTANTTALRCTDASRTHLAPGEQPHVCESLPFCLLVIFPFIFFPVSTPFGFLQTTLLSLSLPLPLSFCHYSLPVSLTGFIWHPDYKSSCVHSWEARWIGNLTIFSSKPRTCILIHIKTSIEIIQLSYERWWLCAPQYSTKAQLTEHA